jgi:hypothetical protein
MTTKATPAAASRANPSAVTLPSQAPRIQHHRADALGGGLGGHVPGKQSLAGAGHLGNEGQNAHGLAACSKSTGGPVRGSRRLENRPKS